MCGISGFAGSIFSRNELKKHIHLACASLHHRGPDDEQHYINDGIALGISRLAIRDIEKGIQPMKRQGLILVFNGELYETQPLKAQLLKLGYHFESECDTEVLLNAFLEFGPSILPKLSGMFAFAIWDTNNKTLYLARDRWGEKPLYYSLQQGSITFGSEIKSLKVWPHINWHINLEDLNIFLRNSYLPNPRVGWNNIFKLEPGCFLIWQNNKLEKKCYFSLEIKEEKKGSLEDAEELFHLLNHNVKQCAVSDRLVGAFLSGGLDSTTVAYFLSRHYPNASVFSLHWDDSEYSEEQYTQIATSSLALNHFSIKCDASFFLNYFDSIVSLYDEPFGDESIIPTYCLAKFAKREVDVVLTGDGADEFFHGYERYFFKGKIENYLDSFAASSHKIHQLICHPDFLNYDQKNLFLSYYLQFPSSLSQERLKSVIDIKTYLTDDILMKVDRACMGVGLESRAPFLTPQVTNFALNCKMEALINKKSRGKEILRTAMKNHLPTTLLERKKMGFGVPLNNWFRSSLKEWMMSRLLNGSLLKTGWFLEKGLKQLISSHIKNQGNYARTLFNLLVLDAWLRKNY